MAKSKNYIVPESELKDYYLLVQRANRRIQANMKYIQQEDIKNEGATRALLQQYTSKESWNTAKTVFSRSKSFDSEADYKSYLRHLGRWGGAEPAHTVKAVKQSYYENIIKALDTVAQEHGIPYDKDGRLPGEIGKAIQGLSLEQITNFFEGSSPVDQLEDMRWSSDLYEQADTETFVDVTLEHVKKLKQLYPSKGKKRRKT